MNVIRIVSGFPYRPHMAGMDDKGRVEVASKIVFATTNQKDFKQVKSIHTPAALMRRFALNLEMRPKEQYRVPFRDGYEDPVWKYTIDDDCKKGDTIDWSFYEWEDKSTGQIYHTIEEILLKVKMTHEHATRKHKETMLDVLKFSDVGLSLRNKPQSNETVNLASLEDL